MIQRLTNLLMTLGLVFSIGLHWSLLQSVAWTTMLVGNLGKTSFSRAVQFTFDGKHPCALCKAIASGKQAEKKKTDSPAPLKKFEGMNRAIVLVILPPASFPRVTSPDAVPEPLAHAPPTPPPRPA